MKQADELGAVSVYGGEWRVFWIEGITCKTLGGKSFHDALEELKAFGCE